jgi:hypothetical protein
MTAPGATGGERPAFSWPISAAIAAAVLVTHVVVNATTPYGIHRDELLYAAMGAHLRLFRMDFPPAIAIIANLERAMLGDSLVSIRLVPAIAGGALILLAAAIARELGGGRFAQALAGVAVASHPLFLRPGNLFQPVVLDQLWWTAALLALTRFERTRDPRWWTAIGVICGLGLLTKFSMLFFGFGLFTALLIADRPALRTRGPWLAFALAFAIGSPSMIGQVRLGFPVLSQMEELRRSQLVHVSFGSFLSWQALLGPSLFLAIAGAVWLLRAEYARRFRILAVTCLAVFATLLLLRGKPYYVGPIYPALFAAGAVWLGSTGMSRTARIGRVAAMAAIILYGAFLFPIGLPVLEPAAMARYAAAIGVGEATRTNRGTKLRLPQDFADMIGWPERVALVAHVYDSLPPAKRAQTVLVGENYGEAGALDYYGPRYGLPPVVSAAGSYWFFGPGERPGDVIITLGVDRRDLEPLCGTVTAAGRITNDWTVEEEQDVRVYVCEHPNRTLQSLWPELAGRN